MGWVQVVVRPYDVFGRRIEREKMENLSADTISPSRFHRTTRERMSASQGSVTIPLRLIGRVDLRGGSVFRIRLPVPRRPEEGTDGDDDGGWHDDG